MQDKQARQAYINEVIGQIRFKKARKSVAAELEGHLEERSLEFIESGLDPKTSEEKAVACMGNPSELGASLNKIHRPKMDWPVMLSVFILSVMGVIVLFNSQLVSLQKLALTNIIKYGVFLAAGVVLMVLIRIFDYTKLMRRSGWLYLLSFLILILTQLFGSVYNGVKVMAIPYVGVLKPDQLCSFLFILAFPGIILKYKDQALFGFIKIGMLCALSLLSLMAIPSLASVLITFITYMILLTTAIFKRLFAQKRWPHMVVLYSSIIILFVLLSLQLGSYQWERISGMFTKGNNPRGYMATIVGQLIQGSKPVGSSSFITSDFFSSLPGSSSEFAFTTIIATMGWVAAIGISLVIGFLLLRMMLKTRQTKTQFGLMLSLAMAGLLGAKFLVSIVGGLGIINGAFTGMPFISYGLTDYIIHMAAIGIFLSVQRINGYQSEEFIRSRSGLFYLEDGKLIIDLGRKSKGSQQHEA